MISTAGRWLWRVRRVTARELWLLAEAQLVLLSCQVAKWRRPAGELIDWSTTEPSTLEPGRIDFRMVEAVAWAVTRAAAYGVFRPRCLVRSLAIQRMLRRRGIDSSTLNIGVRIRNGAFEAHAWVELDGLVVGDSRRHVQSFTRMTDHRLVEL